MKKMYKQPTTEISAFEAESMMQGMVMSPAGPGGPGATDAPRRRGDIIE